MLRSRLLAYGLCLLSCPFGHQALAEAPKAYLDFDHDDGISLHVDQKPYVQERWGSTFSTAASAFDSNPQAADEFHQYLSNHNTGQLVLWCGLAGSVSFLIADYGWWHLPQGLSNTVYYGGLIGAVSGGIYFEGIATEHFYRAINLYNGVTASKTLGRVSYEVKPVWMVSDRGAGAERAPGIKVTVAF